tara:strand:- start:71 stop:190 length:120 start_codon:yes stop_codon:yes gene_type:complete
MEVVQQEHLTLEVEEVEEGQEQLEVQGLLLYKHPHRKHL